MYAVKILKKRALRVGAARDTIFRKPKSMNPHTHAIDVQSERKENQNKPSNKNKVILREEQQRYTKKKKKKTTSAWSEQYKCLCVCVCATECSYACVRQSFLASDAQWHRIANELLDIPTVPHETLPERLQTGLQTYIRLWSYRPIHMQASVFIFWQRFSHKLPTQIHICVRVCVVRQHWRYRKGQ